MDNPEIKFFMGCDSKNGIHALVVADNAVVYQTAAKAYIDLLSKFR